MQSIGHTLKDRVDHLKCLVNLFSHFRTSQHNLPTDEYQKHNLGLDHSVDESREEFRFIRAEHVMAAGKAFETDGKSNVARADDILNLEVCELCVEAKLLDDTGVFAKVSKRSHDQQRFSQEHTLPRCQTRVVL